ncbi:unnamed protein product [Toxocara canis]|uniref:PH domain-containing protein n=1 Tax=Toxocara canis TaxID=6265 RepID=A0A183VF16_TOXCA|nr:unnamed protein product [Toxocara canis]
MLKANYTFAFKLIITIALILAIAIGLFEGDFDFLNTLQLDTNTILLIVCTVILMPMGIVQWYWTDETIRYLAIRDDIYTIPSGKFKWRPEILRPHEIKHERF